MKAESTLYRFALPFFVLLVLTLVAQLSALSYTATQAFVDIFVPSLIALLAVTAPLAALGLWLGSPIGLGAPLLTALLSRSPGAVRKLVNDARLAMIMGLAVGVFLWALRILTAPYLPPELPALGHRGVVGGLLVSAGAAIGEEVWLRLGVMTILAWILVRVRGDTRLKPGSAWAAIILASVVFSLIHLPQLAAAGAASWAGVLGTIFGNTLVGIIFGWLYWRRSLVAAIAAHFSVDLVLHVFPALVT
jgi:membrane protease YdiL (CAAX protease family)